jgi:hypothetical protein
VVNGSDDAKPEEILGSRIFGVSVHLARRGVEVAYLLPKWAGSSRLVRSPRDDRLLPCRHEVQLRSVHPSPVLL